MKQPNVFRRSLSGIAAIVVGLVVLTISAMAGYVVYLFVSSVIALFGGMG